MFLEPNANEEVRFTLAGMAFTLRPSEIRAAVSGHVAEPVHTYWVSIEDSEWPVKQVLSLATGLAAQDFQSASAQRLLKKLGFEVEKRVDRSPKQESSPSSSQKAARLRNPAPLPSPDVILISCSKGKSEHGAPAADLYRSPYFSSMRAYAEESGRPWFILSAKHGLVRPTTWLEPYDAYLPESSRAYRRAWGEKVTQQLAKELGPLSRLVVEVHAGDAYVRELGSLMRSQGAEITEPLKGLTFGLRLAWYRSSDGRAIDARSIIREFANETRRRSVDEFLTSNDESFDSPGIYGWWVDRAGAAELSAGLNETIDEGLLYAGLAGATRTGGKRSKNTLRGRISTMHLGKNHSFSTLRYSVGSILAAAADATAIDETQVTDWMRSHLQIVTVSVVDADRLGTIESEVLTALNPPLNLAKVSNDAAVRIKLKALRKRYAAAGG